MGAILDDGTEPRMQPGRISEAHPEVLDAWLAGVTTADGGEPGAVKEELGL